jgi:urease alpha subunit
MQREKLDAFFKDIGHEVETRFNDKVSWMIALIDVNAEQTPQDNALAIATGKMDVREHFHGLTTAVIDCMLSVAEDNGQMPVPIPCRDTSDYWKFMEATLRALAHECVHRSHDAEEGEAAHRPEVH